MMVGLYPVTNVQIVPALVMNALTLKAPRCKILFPPFLSDVDAVQRRGPNKGYVNQDR